MIIKLKSDIRRLTISVVFILTSLLTINPVLVYSISSEQIQLYNSGIKYFDNVSTPFNCGLGSLLGENNTETVWNYFISKGFTPEQSAGFVGNFLVETAGTMDPRIKQGGELMTDPYDPSDPKGRGLAQWSFAERWQVLLDFAETLKRDPLDIFTQLDFVMFELTGEPTVEGVSGGYESEAYEKIIESTTVEEASVAVQAHYERDQDSIDYNNKIKSYEEAFGERIEASEAAYFELSNNITPSLNCGTDLVIIEGDTSHIPCEGEFISEAIVLGYQDGKPYNIRVCTIKLADGSAGPQVNSQISGNMYQMFLAAWAVGVEMDGGGFRTMEQQEQLRISNGCPDLYDSPASSCRIPTARAGYSNHQMGLAIDFIGVPQCPSSITIDGKSFCQAPGNQTWEWLTAHASLYGLQQLRTEAWHWSVDGG